MGASFFFIGKNVTFMGKLKFVKTAFVVMAAMLIASCKTLPQDAEVEIAESPILELTGITLDGTEWFKTRCVFEDTKEPVKNCAALIFVILEDGGIGKIHTKTDENGYIYIKNLPKGEYSVGLGGQM